MIRQLIIPLILLSFIFSQNRTTVKKTEIVEDTRTVIATGVGVDRDGAVEDGLRNSVEQAIGVFLKSTTIVENAQAIDKLLTHSRGYVKDYDIISEKAEPPLYRVKISATVIVRELKASLMELNLYKKEVSGSSLFAAAMTKVNATQQAIELLEDLFENYPRNAFELEFSEPRIKTGSSDIIDVEFDFTFKWNMDWIFDFEDVLKEVSIDFKEINSFDNTPAWRDQYDHITHPKLENGYFQLHNHFYALNKDIIIYLRENLRKWHSSGARIWPYYEIKLNDASGNIIKETIVKLNAEIPFRLNQNKERRWMRASDIKHTKTAKFQLTLDEMNRIVDISGYATK